MTRGVILGQTRPLASNDSNDSDDDDLVFLDDDLEENPFEDDNVTGHVPWRVLIVDDDADVHKTTQFALGGEHVLGRPLHFHHAYSGAEAIEVLKECDGIALILLDVVMETPDAGLKIIPYIRETLGKSNIRIVLRTGQPGHLTEREVRKSPDINGFLLKSQLTRSMLLNTVESEIREFEATAA